MNDSEFKEWYRINANDLNARRRRRYNKDPEYREAVKQLNIKSNRKRARELELEKARRVKAVKVRKASGSWRTVNVEVDGVSVPMFTIKALARALGRSISTLRVWEANGILPETPYRSSNDVRLYPVEVIEQIYKALTEKGKLKPDNIPERKRIKGIIKRIKLTTGKVEKTRLYRVSVLAKVINKSPGYILEMERGNRMPKTPLRYSTLGIRLYTLSMIEVVKDAFSQFSSRKRSAYEWGRFYDTIELQWIKQKIVKRTINAPNACVLEDR